MLFFQRRKATEIIIFYLFSIILAKRFGLRTPACAETILYRTYGEAQAQQRLLCSSLRGSNHIMCINKKKTDRFCGRGESFRSSNTCLRQGYILPFMRRQRKLSNGRERLVAGLEPYYVYEQKENRPLLRSAFFLLVHLQGFEPGTH